MGCIVAIEREEAGLTRPASTKPLAQESWAVVVSEDRDHDTLPGL